MIAKQSDGVAFDVSPQAVRPWFVLYSNPKARHTAQHCANRLLQGPLALSNLFWGGIPLPPGRVVIAVSLNYSGTDNQPEDRPTVIAAAGVGIAPVLRKTLPKCGTGTTFQGIGSHTHDALALA
jgi:hypothetical protein